MRVEGDYWNAGYARVSGLLPTEVLKELLARTREYFDKAPLDQQASGDQVLMRPVVQVHGGRYQAIESLLWGLTPAISHIVGRTLLPTYCYFRVYQKDDVCYVHRDRPACEISMSLTLAYSDGKPWALDVARAPRHRPERIRPGFEDEAYVPVLTEAGEGVLYKGLAHAHGRVTPNPNAWSAHLFMHWVDGDGPYSDQMLHTHRSAREIDFTLKDAPPLSFGAKP